MQALAHQVTFAVVPLSVRVQSRSTQFRHGAVSPEYSVLKAEKTKSSNVAVKDALPKCCKGA